MDQEKESGSEIQSVGKIETGRGIQEEENPQENNERKSKKDLAKKAGITAGKLGLTAISLPLGLPTFFKRKRVRAGLLGLFLNWGIMYSTLEYSEDTLYKSNNLEVKETKQPVGSSLLDIYSYIGKALINAPWAISSHEPQTKVYSKGDSDYNNLASAMGHDIIQFNDKTGKYELNFNEDTEFYSLREFGKTSLESVKNSSDLEKHASQLKDLLKEQREYEANGNMEKAKETALQVQESLKEYNQARETYESRLDTAKDRYQDTKQRFKTAVEKMNGALAG